MTYFENKRVVVTGGAGMVGVQLVKLLVDQNASVVVLDDFSRGNNRVKNVEYKIDDAGREGVCRQVFKDADIVFNLAAEVAGVEFNQKHHSFMFERNFRLQHMPLKIAAEYGVEKFLQTSSVCVYAPEYNNPALEENGLKSEPVQANIGYSYAKRTGERLAKWYAEEKSLHTVIVRPSNIYGPHDYFDERAHVIPALIKKCLEDDKIIVNGTGNEKREFIYSTDVARGMMAAVEYGNLGGAYNLGTTEDTAITIKDLVRRIQNAITLGNRDILEYIWEKDIVFESRFDSGDNARWSNSTKAGRDLYWCNQTSLNIGLARTIDWYVKQKQL